MDLWDRTFGSRFSMYSRGRGYNNRYEQDDDSDDDSLPLPTPLAELLSSTHISSPQSVASDVDMRSDDSNVDSPKLSLRDRKLKDQTSSSSESSNSHENGTSASNGMKIGNFEQQEEAQEGMCVECVDQPASIFCEQCQDDYCSLCWKVLHKRGSRSKHLTKNIDLSKIVVVPSTGSSSSSTSTSSPSSSSSSASSGSKTTKTVAEIAAQEVKEAEIKKQKANGGNGMEEESDEWTDLGKDLEDKVETKKGKTGEWFVERSKYVPLRLTASERQLLRLLETGLNVSEYTDRIDVYHRSRAEKQKKILLQLEEICAVIGGLKVASDYKLGLKLMQGKDFKDNAELFSEVFEVGRRYKIMNPEKMRAQYGKLIYLLQDSNIDDIKQTLGFECVKKVKTVHDLLTEKQQLDILRDDDISVATMVVTDRYGALSRSEVAQELAKKEQAIKRICQRYKSDAISEEDIHRVLLSIGDNFAFLNANRDPADKMISYLKQNFQRTSTGGSNSSSLMISTGRGGARLSHDHQTQYDYVIQSFTLWREICSDMFRLWYLSEEDLLDGSGYRLSNTGQGLNRMQSAPKVGRAMDDILRKCRTKVEGYWVGSSAVHLGDINVPNALMFIDKYTQVARILSPIVRVIEEIDRVSNAARSISMEDEEREGNDSKKGEEEEGGDGGSRKVTKGIEKYIKDNFESADALKKLILKDFFRHGFDGSGADDYFSAGSCIDGRLTSAWNWCSLLEKKEYYPVFKLLGFVGFDGNFQK